MMAKKFILPVVLYLTMLNTFAQVSGPQRITDAPAAVSTQFTTDYPHVSEYTWFKASDAYRVVFHGSGNLELYVTYDAAGKKLGTGRQILFTGLPVPTQSYLNDSHPNAKNLKVYLQTKTDGSKWYEVSINNQWFLFDAKGKQVPIK